MADPENAESRRIERRYRCALAVTLRRRGADQALLSGDVSFRGAYIRTTTPPPLNSLVRLVLTLPPDDAKIALSAHVTRVALQDNVKDQYPGFVARFVGLDGPVKERWEQLISWVRAEYGQSVITTVTFARPSYVRLFQQKAPAGEDLWIRPTSIHELRSIVEHEIPSGVVLVPSAGAVAPGVNVTVRLQHPITGDIFPIPGVVRRRGAGHDARPGALVALTPLPLELRVGLSEMLESVVVVDDYDVELYAEPSLEPSSAPG